MFRLIAAESERLDYLKTVDQLAQDWAQYGPDLELSAALAGPATVPPTTEVPLDRRVVVGVQGLIDHHMSTRDTLVEKITRLFETLQIVPAADRGPLQTLAREWKTLVDTFVPIAHERTRLDDQLLDREFIRAVRAFEMGLFRFASAKKFFAGLDEVDDILVEANRRAD